jgi:hypothetical protein
MAQDTTQGTEAWSITSPPAVEKRPSLGQRMRTYFKGFHSTPDQERQSAEFWKTPTYTWANLEAKEWDEDKHPRVPAGSPQGGEWASAHTTTTEETLTPEQLAYYDKFLAESGLTREAVFNELMSKLVAKDGTIDTPLLTQARKWYAEANAWAHQIASETGISFEQAAAIIAAISPNSGWQVFTQFKTDERPDGESGNRIEAMLLARFWAKADHSRSADDLAKEFRSLYSPTGNNSDHHLGSGLTAAAIEMNANRAFSILKDGSLANIHGRLGTLKMASFYNNIGAPARTNDVTVDRHMAKVLYFASTKILSPKDVAALLNERALGPRQKKYPSR